MKKSKIMAFALLLLGAATLGVLLPSKTLAATVTWTGGGADGNWSTVGNWAGGIAPVAGDTVVIDNAANFTNGSSMDIAGLSITTLSFINNDAGSGIISVDLAQNLTITTSISQEASVTTTNNVIGGTNPTPRTITLGGNVIATVTAGGLDLGTLLNNDVLDLNGNTLTINDRGGSTAGIFGLIANTTGSGGIIINAPVTNVQFWGTNNYTGSTTVTNNNLPVSVENGSSFGSSSVSVGPLASVSFNSSSNSTINNTITVAAIDSSNISASLSFNATGSNIVFTVPNITLNGDTRFSSNLSGATGEQINLAGITANSHCVQYLGGSGGDTTNGPANGFLNGPAGCIVSGSPSASASTPSAPNTGFKVIKSNPITTLIVTFAITFALIALGRKLNTKNQ